ncbi:MAG: amino acid synthesis family protein [Pseudomonadota bacterium]
MSEPVLRKSVLIREVVTADETGRTSAPITRVAIAAVIENPFAGGYVEDLSPLFAAGRAIGERLMGEAVAALGGAPVSYGKGAIVGVAGEAEHGAAVLHPMLGKPMRAAVGGGASLIPSTVKLGAVGAVLDLPLGHKDEAWAFNFIDTMSVMVGDAPRPGEIVIIMGLADGGRAQPRVGSGPRTD